MRTELHQFSMAKVKLLLSYDGTDFCGWQKQKDHAFASGLPSVQETVEKALKKILTHEVELSASGRTDAGVHAIGQIVHFDTPRAIPKDICWALRAKLPSTISAKAAWEVPEDFHATLSATHKTYRYWIWNQNRPTALLNRYSWWIRRPINLDYLNDASQILVKKQDFASFRSVGSPVRHTIREVFSAQWSQRKSGMMQFEITGSGFLKQMVRNIVGTLVDNDARNKPIGHLSQILELKDRTKAGPAAPPNGLFLYRVYYPKDLDKRCRQT